jgi:hypothetical protein
MTIDDQTPERHCIEVHLIPRLRSRMDQWEKEYKQERDLGQRGEFVGLYRKVRKLKTALWDSAEPPASWREDVETILYEVIGHAFLMLHDDCPGDADDLDEHVDGCPAAGHQYGPNCAFIRMP